MNGHDLSNGNDNGMECDDTNTSEISTNVSNVKNSVSSTECIDENAINPTVDNTNDGTIPENAIHGENSNHIQDDNETEDVPTQLNNVDSSISSNINVPSSTNSNTTCAAINDDRDGIETSKVATRELDSADEIPSKRLKTSSDNAIPCTASTSVSLDDDNNFNSEVASLESEHGSVVGNEPNITTVSDDRSHRSECELLESNNININEANNMEDDNDANDDDDDEMIIRQRYVGSSSFEVQEENNANFYGTSVNVNLMQQQESPVKDDDLQTDADNDTAIEANTKCLRKGCPNLAVANPEWENVYCSNECVINHTKEIFVDWIKRRQQTLINS